MPIMHMRPAISCDPFEEGAHEMTSLCVFKLQLDGKSRLFFNYIFNYDVDSAENTKVLALIFTT